MGASRVLVQQAPLEPKHPYAVYSGTTEQQVSQRPVNTSPSSMPSFLSMLLSLLALHLMWPVATLQREDINFETLFEDSTDEVWPAAKCFAVRLPSHLAGYFVIQSTSRYSMGGRAFNSWLDAFWKIHSFELSSGNSLCYKSRRILTGFYNK